MRTVHKIGIGVLVGLFFASGNIARSVSVYNHDRSQSASRTKAAILSKGMQVASSRLSDVANVDIEPLGTLYTVVRSLREHYVEQLTVESEGKMTYDAMRAMVGSLGDPKTRFIEPKERKLIADADEGKFHGIGAILAVRQTFRDNKDKPKERISTEHLVVVSLLPDGPAARAGLKPGDEILAIDGKDVLPFNPYQRVNDMINDSKFRKMERSQQRKTLEAEQKRIDDGIAVLEAEHLLMSEGKKPIELTLAAKPPAKQTKVSMTPEDLTVDPVSPLRMESSDAGYIKVNYLGSTTAAEFAEAMKELESKPASGLIVDLRGATGGSIRSAEQIASYFAPDETLAVLIRSRGRKTPVRAAALTGTSAWRKPTVLLVDHSTSRIAEVLAAGLKENGVAKIVGEKTSGDFLDTTVMDLADGSAILMATGKYVTAKGVDYNGKGVPVDAYATTSDQQLRTAIKLLSAGGKS